MTKRKGWALSNLAPARELQAGEGQFHFETRDFSRGFGNIFGRGGRGFGFRGGWPQDGEDLRTDISISFEEAISGAEVILQVPGMAEFTLRVPPLVADGALIKAAGRGEAGSNGGNRGDLFVRVKVGKHPTFEREGLNLRMKQEISFAEAALGGNVIVPTYNGESVTMVIPPGHAVGQHIAIAQKRFGKQGLCRGSVRKSGSESSHRSQPQAAQSLGNFCRRVQRLKQRQLACGLA